jgi:hypothetical protein
MWEETDVYSEFAHVDTGIVPFGVALPVPSRGILKTNTGLCPCSCSCQSGSVNCLQQKFHRLKFTLKSTSDT